MAGQEEEKDAAAAETAVPQSATTTPAAPSNAATASPSSSLFSLFCFSDHLLPSSPSRKQESEPLSNGNETKNPSPSSSPDQTTAAASRTVGESHCDPQQQPLDAAAVVDPLPSLQSDKDEEDDDDDEEGSHSANSEFFDQLFRRRASVEVGGGPQAHTPKTAAATTTTADEPTTTLNRNEVERLLSDPAVVLPPASLILQEEEDEDHQEDNVSKQEELSPRQQIVVDSEQSTTEGAVTTPEKTTTTTTTLPPMERRHPRNAGPWTVLAFVNSGSGGQKGEVVYKDLVRLLGASHVFDLSKVKKGHMPEDKLLPYALDPNVRVLACGGDGTMGWIESSIDTVWSRVLGEGVPVEKSSYKGHLPLAIMPLGTGNDLSRTFGWGPQYSRVMGKPEMIRRIETAVPCSLDRWRCVVIPDKTLDQETRDWIPDMLGYKMVDHNRESIFERGDVDSDNASFSIDKELRKLVGLSTTNNNSTNVQNSGVSANKKATEEQPEPTLERLDTGSSEVLDGIFCNYMSIGMDAQIAFSFHKDRREHPEKFTSVTGNKLKYASAGFSQGSSAPRLRGKLKLLVSSTIDKETSTMKEIPIPKACRAVVLLNIQSYGGGNRLANQGSHDDGLIDVVFVTTVWRLAVIGGMASILPFTRYRLAAQAERVCIKTHVPLHCQVDGEPWLQGAATINVRHFGKSTVLQRRRDTTCLFNCATGDATVTQQ